MEQKGNLPSGKTWEVVPSAKKAVEEGQHWIMHIAEGSPAPNLEEKGELLSLAHKYASENALEKERFRVAVNGGELASRKDFHVHIIFPVGDDELPRLVGSS